MKDCFIIAAFINKFKIDFWRLTGQKHLTLQIRLQNHILVFSNQGGEMTIKIS